MKPVKQQDGLGCAIACVAFVSKSTYQDSISLFNRGRERAQQIGFFCKDIVNVLNSRGYNYQFKYVKPRIKNVIYKENSIVFVKRSQKYKYGHFLVRYKNLWMDPWINFPNIEIKAGFRKRLPGKAIYVVFQ